MLKLKSEKSQVKAETFQKEGKICTKVYGRRKYCTFKKLKQGVVGTERPIGRI